MYFKTFHKGTGKNMLMKFHRNHLEFGLLAIVYLFALYLWTLPFQDNSIPYGEWDAISHWELADYIAQTDRTFVYLPPFLDYPYGKDNNFRQHTLWYHPPFHVAMAIVSAFSGERAVPIYLTNAIFATFIILAVYFVIRKLYGFSPAILSAFLLSLSMRDIMPYLWGQWPERLAYAFVPVILYCFYKYYTTYSKENSKPIYLYIMSLILAIDMLIHPLIFFHSFLGLVVLFILLSIKNRIFPFNIKHLFISLVLFLVIFAIFPYQTGNVIVSFKEGQKEEKKASFSRLFKWAPDAKDFVGSVPESYFSFSYNHGLWTLPFLLVGIIILLIRRENRDLLLLAWLISLYLVLHRDLAGKAAFLHRSLSATAHIFIPITVIGALSVHSFLKLPKNFSTVLKYSMVAVVFVLALVYNMPKAYSTLNGAYDSPFLRLNQAQIDASEWLRENTALDQNVSVIGPPPQLMQKVWWMASYSYRTSYFFEGFLKWKTYAKNREDTVRNHLINDYIVVDYSDIIIAGEQALVDELQKFEKDMLSNHTLAYNKNNIRIYKWK